MTIRERPCIVITAKKHNTSESYHMHYYKFNIGDYASHTAHLEPLEDIAYRRMIDWLYLNEIPLPKSIPEIGRLIRMRSHSDCIANVLREFFEAHSDGYRQPRIERELQEYAEKSEKARKSAKKRWDKKPSKQAALADANALRTECERNANHKPLTNNHIDRAASHSASDPPAKKSQRSKPKKRIPENFTVTPALITWVEENDYAGINLSAETDRFIDYWKGKGEAKADWAACWRTWIRNADKFQREKAGRAGGRAAIAAAIHGD